MFIPFLMQAAAAAQPLPPSTAAVPTVDPALLSRVGTATSPGSAATLAQGAASAAEHASAVAQQVIASPAVLTLGGLALLGLGVAGGYWLNEWLEQTGTNRNKARWPRDWPKDREVFTRDPNPAKPGYLALDPKQAMGSGAMQLGRTYPRWSIFPDQYPFREMRRRVRFWSSKPVWIPKAKRFQHFSILGATGKGKSTSYATPILAYGALEQDTAYYAIDVKSPEFVRMFAALYKQAGKEVLFFDPWSIEETLAFEPLWRANEERKDILADIIATYSADSGQQSSSENSEFFRIAATRLLRGAMDLAQFFPRRYCNLPAVQQLIGSGGNVLKEAFEKSGDLMPTIEEVIAAIETLLPLAPEVLRQRPRNDAVEHALGVLDRSGYMTAYYVKRMRRYEAEHEQGKVSSEQMAEVRQAFWAQIKHEWVERRQKLDQILMTQGEFLNAPEDTRNSVVSTLTNKVNWFRDPNIARAFSRDELDIRALIERPCLFLVGAPMAKLKVGSLFVSAILSNLTLNAVFQRGMSIARREKGISKHPIFFLLDEFVQLKIREAPSILATFRGFMSGLVMIFQERGQLRQLYGDDATTMEGNTVHKVLMQGAHEETCEFYAQKAIGTAMIKKVSKSGVSGEKKSISESVESVSLMETQDVKAMRLNGQVQPGMALSIGADVPAFPLMPVPFYDDPVLRKLLNMKRRVIKKDAEGRPTWKFWLWDERWEPSEEGNVYLSRRRQRTPAERAAGVADPVYERLQDPYTQYLDYLLGDARGQFDELVEPRLVLTDIGVTENDPRAAALAAARAAAPGRAPAAMPQGPTGMPGASPASGGATSGRGGPAVPATMLVPVYAADFRQLINDDFQATEAVSAAPPTGGALDERFSAEDEL